MVVTVTLLLLLFAVCCLGNGIASLSSQFTINYTISINFYASTWDSVNDNWKPNEIAFRPRSLRIEIYFRALDTERSNYWKTSCKWPNERVWVYVSVNNMEQWPYLFQFILWSLCRHHLRHHHVLTIFRSSLTIAELSVINDNL